jgi:hypothetical protein
MIVKCKVCERDFVTYPSGIKRGQGLQRLQGRIVERQANGDIEMKPYKVFPRIQSAHNPELALSEAIAYKPRRFNTYTASERWIKNAAYSPFTSPLISFVWVIANTVTNDTHIYNQLGEEI